MPMPQSHPPLGLLYVGAVLEARGHEVRIIDEDVDHLSGLALKQCIADVHPDVVGITSTTPVFPHAASIAALAKAAGDIAVVLGGIHATIAAEESIQHEAIDVVVRGEGEGSAVLLMEALEQGKSLEGLEGISFRRDGEVVHNPDRGLIMDLDTLPFPGRHLLRRPFAYEPPDALYRPTTTIMTSRGCPYGCTFCCTKQIFGRRLRFRSIANVIEEIEHLVRNYGVRELQIMDDCFTAKRERVFEFRDALRAHGLTPAIAFGNGLRADQVDDEIMSALKEIGVYSVGFGVESGNEEILARIKKGTTLDVIRNAFRLSKRYGFETWGFFMIGLPGETRETIRDTIRFAKELDPDFAKFIILKPYPGSEIHRELMSEHLIFKFDYTQYGPYTPPVHFLPSLSAKEIERWQRKANREFYLRPSKIWSHLRRLKSFEQLRHNLRSAWFILKKSI
jgi:anaerobic magnesium-protoporphyrin IX monomethyl ester cyclase